MERDFEGSADANMDFMKMEQDQVYGPILQQKALEYLQAEQSEYFNENFTGELDPGGYLIRKDGVTPNTKPSQNIGGGVAMERVLEMVRAEMESPAQ